MKNNTISPPLHHDNTHNSHKTQHNPMWGGLIGEENSSLLTAINESISFDHVLYAHDIEASIAHATMLAKQNIITHDECQQIITGLQAIKHDIDKGDFTFDTALEDIHMNIEYALKQRIGDVAGKLHTARSRNDQVSTDMRLWLRDKTHHSINNIKLLRRNILTRAKQYYATPMPGFTHLQTAQPVTLGHHLLAYYDMFSRDLARFEDSLKRTNISPLGAAALAGTTYNIDRHYSASLLKFDDVMHNSMDAVSSRDYIIEYLAAASIHAMHLSRLAEEMVLFSSHQFGFFSFSDAFSTGSSIMPQKRNPDAAELIRAKPARIFAALHGLLVVLKALPLTYSKDMQEDKEMLFDAVRNIDIMQRAMAGLVLDVTINDAAMLQALEQGYPTATDAADWLVSHLNIPFRDAHHITGQIVKLASTKKCALSALSLDELQHIQPNITADIFRVLSIEHSLNMRQSYGGTAPKNILAIIDTLEKNT